MRNKNNCTSFSYASKANNFTLSTRVKHSCLMLSITKKKTGKDNRLNIHQIDLKLVFRVVVTKKQSL